MRFKKNPLITIVTPAITKTTTTTAAGINDKVGTK